jgi:3-dehydroquinate dehydratase
MIRVNFIGPFILSVLLATGCRCHYHQSCRALITSVGIIDAIKAFEGPVMEVHISHIHARDDYHQHSKISFVATGVIARLGPFGYIAAMNAIAQMS